MSPSQNGPSENASTSDTGARTDLPPISFGSFVVSLASSAMVQLGEIDDPTTGDRTVNLPMARQTIDLLEILKEKTAGNLDEDESRLLESLLYDLRSKYVQASG